jgi:hypothetical protein
MTNRITMQNVANCETREVYSSSPVKTPLRYVHGARKNHAMSVVFTWRRGRDSNSGYLAVCLLSKQVH